MTDEVSSEQLETMAKTALARGIEPEIAVAGLMCRGCFSKELREAKAKYPQEV